MKTLYTKTCIVLAIASSALLSILATGCKSGGGLTDFLHNFTETLISPLGETDFTHVAMPDPDVKTDYDNDYKNMVKFYTDYVKSYAEMKRILALAGNQKEIADKLAAEIAEMEGNSNMLLIQSDRLIKDAEEIQPPTPKLQKTSETARKAARDAEKYAVKVNKNFNHALVYARAISSRYYSDFETKYDKDKKETLNVGPGFKKPLREQENMKRINEIAGIIKNINGNNLLKSLGTEINSWFEDAPVEE